MPNNDYIKRSDAIEALCGQCRFYDSSNDCGVRPCFVATRKDQINAIPAADVEPVRHGRWVYGYDVITDKHEYICDQCGYAPYYCGSIYNYKYCPNCGAKMDEEKNYAEIH